jgi:hypothetical protein
MIHPAGVRATSVHPQRVKLGVTRNSTDGHELRRPTDALPIDRHPASYSAWYSTQGPYLESGLIS